MPTGDQQRRPLAAASRAAAIIGVAVLVANALLVVWDGILRGIFGMPQSWVADIAEATLPPALSAFFPYALGARYMIQVPLIGGVAARLRRIFDTFGAAALTAVVGLMAAMAADYAAEIATSGRATWLLKLPLAPTWALVAAIWIAALAVQLAVLVDTARHRGHDHA